MSGELKPLRSAADHQAALAEIEALWGSPSGTPEGDRLDVLATLIDVYEAQSFFMDMPDPVDAILFRMEQQGLTRKDLEPMLGNRGRISEILSRKRPLSLDMIRALHQHLGIPASILIRPIRKAA